MNQPTVKPRRRKKLLIMGGVLLLLALTGFWYTTTNHFHAWLRDRVVTELQNATGGRVELDGFHMIPFRLRLEGRNLTIHGTEKAGEIPLLHADTVVAELRFTSIFMGHVGFEQLVLEHPVLHVELASDGTSNIPAPQGQADNRTGVEQMFDLSIRRLEVHSGELLWNDQSIPMDFAANDITGGMAHALFHRRYDGRVHVGKIDTKLQDFRAFAWSSDLEFGLTRNRLDIKSLNLASGRSRLHFAGELLDFTRPQVSGKYEAQVDMGEAGSVTRTKELTAGTAAIQGEGKCTQVAFALNGKLSVRDGLWKMDNGAIRVASGSTQYSLTDRLEFRDLQARAFGGSVTGDVNVNHWLGEAFQETAVAGKSGSTKATATKSNPKKSSPASKHADSVGEVHLKLRDLAVGDLLSLLNSKDLPLDRLHAVGFASGTLESKWTKRIETADTEVDLNVKAPEQVAGGTLPLAGTAHGTHHAATDQLDVAQFNLGTQGTRLEASGSLGTKSSNLHVAVNTANLSEWEALISGFRGTSQVPLNVAGHGSFTGVLSGSLEHPTVAGKLEFLDFTATPRGASTSAFDHLHWDRLTAEVQASQQSVVAHHGVLQHGSTQVNFDTTIGLDHGAFTPSSLINAEVFLQDASIEELQSIFGYSYPISGRMSFAGQLGGNKSSPHGDGVLQVKNATVYGEPMPLANAKVKWAGSELTLEDVDAEYASGHVRGTFGYNVDNGTFHSQLAGEGFEVAALPKIRDSQILASGRLKFTATGSGTFAEPSVDAAADVEHLVLGEEDEGSFHVEARTRGEDMHFSGQSSFQAESLTLNGDVHLRGDWPVQATAQFQHLDIDPLLQRYLRGRVTGHSAFSGTFELRGPLRRPAELAASGELSQLTAVLQNINIANDGPVRFQVANQVFHLDEAHLVGDNTKLSAGGTIQLTGRRELDVHASGQLNLGLLQTMYPDFLTTGSVDIQGRATGTVSEPILQGKVLVTAGGLAVPGQPASLSDINGTLMFTQDRLQIEQLTARSGGGLIRLGGYLQYGRYLEFNVTAQGEDVRLRYPPGMSSTANADLRLYGTSNGAVLSGELQVTRFSLSQGFDFGSYLSSSRQSTVLTGSDSLLNKIRFDLHIFTTPDLRFDSSLARVSGDADLRLRGTMAKPVLLGRTNIQEGQIFFNGAKYQLERGDISFTNPVKIDPVLDLAASIRVRDYDIEIGFHGTSDKLNVVYRSEPPLPQADIIALLALGRTQEESAQMGASQSAFTQEASNAILGQAINATVSSRVQKLFGVSRIKIDPQAPGTETSTYQGPQVTIEQQVSNKLTLTYVQPVSQATQQTIQGEYNVTRNVSIVAVRDQNGVFALDIRIRHRKK
jgi:translocation and assembly module TamB